MGDIVRRGKLILDLVAGKQELEAPDVKEFLAAKEKQVELEAQLKKAIDDAKAAQDALTEAAQKHQQTQKISATLSFEQAQALQKIASGSLLVARSFVLMGASSDESMQKIVKDLAAVQGGIDLFKGSTLVLRGLTSALGMTAAASTALMATMTPVLGVVALASAGFLLWRTRAEETAEAERQLAEAIAQRAKEQADAAAAARAALEGSREQLRDERRRSMSPQQLQESLERERARVNEARDVFRGGMSGINPQTDAQRAALDEAKAMINDLERRDLELRRQIREAQAKEAAETQKQFSDFMGSLGDIIRTTTDALTGQQKKQTTMEMALQALKPR